jgi:phage shock protein A
MKNRVYRMQPIDDDQAMTQEPVRRFEEIPTRAELRAEVERLAQSVAQSITELTLTNERLKALLGELRAEVEQLQAENHRLRGFLADRGLLRAALEPEP